MKRIYLMILFATLATIVSAQTDDKGYKEGAWVLKGVTGINMSQTAMTNWSAGGENSIAGNAYLNGSLTHKSGNWLWVTNLVLDYGLSKTKSQGMLPPILMWHWVWNIVRRVIILYSFHLSPQR